MNTKKIKNNIETKKNLKQKHFLHSTFYILHSTDSGFTLIETLVSLLIFSVSIAAMIFVTSHGVADATYAKNKLVASYLAQEGIELVRYARDSDVLANKDTGWGQFVSDISLQYNCFQPLLCHADPESFAIESGNPPIYFDGDTFTGYNYSSGYYKY